jgi:hypothetical protein
MNGKLMTLRRVLAPPKAAVVDPNAIPARNLAGANGATAFTWQLRNAEDFNTDIALGGIYPISTGPDTGLLDPACPAYAAYGTKWKVKTALSPDTDGNALYSAVDTMSIANSYLTIHLNVHPTNGPVGSAIKPLNQSTADTNYFTYGRWAVRWRAVANPITGGTVTGLRWGAVSFAIPDNAHFPIWSEMDWLEAGLASANPGGFWHPGGDTINNSIAQAGVGGVPFSEWHTSVIEWLPDPLGARTRWYDNGNLGFETTTDTPVSPAKLGWLIQTASSGGIPTGDANVQIDWYCQWDYVP